MKKFLPAALVAVFIGLLPAKGQVTFQNHSKTPALVTLNAADFPGVKAYGLISSSDTLAGSPSYRFAGSADGAGLLKNADGTFTYVVNQEDNFSVSRITLDATFKPIKGEYLMNSDAGMWRLCSGTLATPEVHGFGPVFITCGESSVESMVHMINPNGTPITDANTSNLTTIAGFGRWSAENAVPLPKGTYDGKTVVIIGDDDSGPLGGQVVMYVSTPGDLNNGSIYVLRRKDQNQSERQMTIGNKYAIEFVQIPNHKSMTGAQLNTYCDATLKGMKFGRVEDIDYRKGTADAAREFYFTVTGSNFTGQDSIDKTIFGRVYRVNLDANNPLSGTIECILDGDIKSITNPAYPLYDPDNICVTEDYVYVQEDPNSYTMSWALPYVHDARIYQYDIQTKTMKTVLEFDHRRSTPDSATYNRNSAGTAYSKGGIGTCEYGALVDVSKETGVDNSFVLSLQPHNFRFPYFAGVDGGTLRATENQGSMLVTLTGLPRIKPLAPTVSSATVCAGQSAKLTASNGSTFAATNGTMYKWYTAASGGSAFFTGNEYTTPALSTAATYYVSSMVSGFESSTRTAVTVNVNSNPIFDLGADKSVCESALLDAGTRGVPSVFTWSNGKSTNAITVTESGKYKVTVLDVNSGCRTSDSVNVTINPKPAAPAISVLYGMVLKSDKTSGNTWYKNGLDVSTSQTYAVTSNGNYTLTYTDNNGCKSDAASVSFTSLSTADAFELQGFRLFPNPNSGTFTLKYESAETQNLKIYIVNTLGQLVYTEEVNNFSGNYNNVIDMSREAAGNYIVNIVTDKTTVQKKIVKQ